MKTVIVTGISSDIAQALKNQLEQSDWRVVGLTHSRMDLANYDSVVKEADSLIADVPQIDAVVHIAGIWHNETRALAGMMLDEFSPKEVSDAINVGLTSFMILMSKLLPHATQNAVVVGVSGTYEDGGAGWLPYFVSKRGLEDFLIGLAQEQAEKLEVFGVSPSDTNTHPYAKFYPNYAADGQSPELVAGLIADLLERRTPYKTGDIIKIKKGDRSAGYHA